ncbi:MAG: hypothetical protein EOO71_05415 [Myxococcaceae bacterium]|nr:MAG: hypothetical protein EOO71_05415 [Myxococcaceae bacterium]
MMRQGFAGLFLAGALLVGCGGSDVGAEVDSQEGLSSPLEGVTPKALCRTFAVESDVSEADACALGRQQAVMFCAFNGGIKASTRPPCLIDATVPGPPFRARYSVCCNNG